MRDTPATLQHARRVGAKGSRVRQPQRPIVGRADPRPNATITACMGHPCAEPGTVIVNFQVPLHALLVANRNSTPLAEPVSSSSPTEGSPNAMALTWLRGARLQKLVPFWLSTWYRLELPLTLHAHKRAAMAPTNLRHFDSRPRPRDSHHAPCACSDSSRRWAAR
jgi:hypothetical protein